MRFTAATLALASTASAAVLKGFNYGATHTDQSPMTQNDFQTLFQNAQKLSGAPGFTSARLYTMIQAGTTSDPTSAIAAAIATKTQLLLGMWASAGQTTINNEMAAFNASVKQYGSTFTDLIVGISVGSEDLYRDSILGIQAKAGIGASPDTVSGYIDQVRSAVKGSGVTAPIGHVDTWTAWVNTSVSAVAKNSDFIGMDAYPYFQSTMANDISVSKDLFDSAYAQTKAASQGKPIWVTETGWPVSGPQSNQAAPSTQNAKQYWDQVGCGELFGQVNTFWYTLQDALPSTPAPSFGLVTSGTTPLYDLSCSNITTSAIPTSTASATAGSTASATDAGSPGISGAGGSGAGAGGSSATVLTYTNSAGVTVATSIAIANGTSAPTVGTPVAPTSTAGITTVPSGGAVANAGSIAGVFGAALAVVAAL